MTLNSLESSRLFFGVSKEYSEIFDVLGFQNTKKVIHGTSHGNAGCLFKKQEEGLGCGWRGFSGSHLPAVMKCLAKSKY